MRSKYFDYAMAIFMAIFAYTRFANEQYGFGALFVVLFLLNILTIVMKHKNEKNNTEPNKK